MSKLDSIINLYENFCLKTLRDSYDLSLEINENIGFACDKCGDSQNFRIGNIFAGRPHICSECFIMYETRISIKDDKVYVNLISDKNNFGVRDVLIISKDDVLELLIKNLSLVERIRLLKLATNKYTRCSFLRYMGMDSHMDLDNLYYIQKISSPVLAVQETTYSENKYTHKGIMVAPKNTIKVNDLVEVLWEDDDKVLVYKDSGKYLINKNCVSRVIMNNAGN